MSHKIITISFYILFFFTPLFWTPFNFELFEYNKMMLVYLLTIIITTFWLIKMIQTKSLILKTTPLDIPLILFLGANILSTIFSIDPHTSIWGYYSRSNGGLLSIISYTVLYYALVSNFDSSQVLKFLKAAILGGVIVALWAIPEHFGVSPSCVVLTGEFNAACWVQDVAARVFATLGQPNWLAAYLGMLIFPALYFLLTAKSKFPLFTFYFSLIALYLAFTFTKSRGGTLGLLAGLGIFLALTVYLMTKKEQYFSFKNLTNPLTIKLSLFLTSILIINLIYGSALISRFEGMGNLFFTNAKPTQQLVKSTQTQLETEGEETPKIRFIVWQGALEIFKHYPLFGSGVETFAYSYYTFRPQSHNLTSEWDFLYNKAHNEYLNYLATTGIVGFLSYMTIIVTFIIWCIKGYGICIKYYGKVTSDIKTLNTYYIILIPALLASYISYLVQNFFGFSVVMIALFFFLFPALAFVASDSAKPFKLPRLLTSHFSLLTSLYRRSLYPKIAQAFIIITSILLLVRLTGYYRADILYAQGSRANEAGNPGKAYNALIDAQTLNDDEPLYKNELGYAAAAAAVSLAEEDSTSAAQLKERAETETKAALDLSPKNVSLWRTAVRTYYLLSNIDQSYTTKTLQALDQAIRLAPTDAKLFYNKAVILGQEKRNQEAIKNLEEAIRLRPNYRDAYYSLGLFYFEDQQKEKAIEMMKEVLKLSPGDAEAKQKLEEWKK